MGRIDVYKLEKANNTEGRFDKEGVLTLIEQADGKKYAFFLCPCGCQAPHMLPVRPCEGRPSWEFSEGPHGPTLSPSILNLGGCKSHFFIEDGKVRWC